MTLDRRTYGPKLHDMRPLARAFRLTVRRSHGRILAVELWQETPASRGFYSDMQQIDRWYADDLEPVSLARDSLSNLLAEAVLQRRLPGID